MRTLTRRVKSLEGKSQGDNYQETLSFLTFWHEIKHGCPPWGLLSVEAKEELEGRAKELTAQGIHYSLKEIIREIQSKGSIRPVEKGGRQ